jgi:DNA-binding PadR family transcriptional regulator
MEKLKAKELLSVKNPVTINKKLAKYLGLNESVMVQQIHIFIKENKNSNTNFINNKYGVRSSIDSWSKKEFCFFSESTIKRTLQKLEKIGIIEVEMFNESKMDKTKWYTINYDELFEFCQNESKEKLKFHGYVYLIKDLLGHTKIGYTKNIKERLEQLKRIKKSELFLIHLLKTSDMVTLESFFHKKFDSKRVEGEWFKLNQADIEYIKNGIFPKEIKEVIMNE